MTHEEAVALKSFDHYCNCGGFVRGMGGTVADPHMTWCPQRPQYLEWFEAMNKKEEKS